MKGCCGNVHNRYLIYTGLNSGQKRLPRDDIRVEFGNMSRNQPGIRVQKENWKELGRNTQCRRKVHGEVKELQVV